MNDDERASVRAVSRAGVVGLAGLILTLAVAAGRGGFVHEIFDDAPPQPRVIQAFSRVPAAGGIEGAGVRSRAHLRLRRLNRTPPWRVSFLARSARAAGSTLTVAVDEQAVWEQALTPEWTSVSFAIPARAMRGAVIEFSVERSSRPAVISDVTFQPSSWFWLNAETLWASLALSLGIGLLVVSAGAEPRAIAAGFGALVVLALVVTRGLGEGPYVPWTVGWGLAAVAAGSLANWWLGRRSERRDWRAAIVLAAAALAAHGWILGHPLIGIGDSQFHQHRFQTVQNGEYFFTSDAPGGAFPYPVALYVLAGPFAGLVEDTRWLLRAFAIVAHAGAGLAIFAAVRRWRPADEAFWAQVIFLAVPVGYHTFAVAYLTNSFGQSMSVMALAAAVAWPFDRQPLRGAVVLAAAASAAFLAHLGTFMMLGLCLAALTAGLFVHAPERPRARLIALSTSVAVLFSVLIFYGWFGDTYRAMLSRPAVAAAPADAPPPVMRREAHQTQYVPGLAALRVRLAAMPRYVERYYGWWLLPLAMSGWLAARRRPSDPLRVLVGAWLATGGVFFVLGHVSSLDIRYYLGTYPAFALLGAQWVTGGPPIRAAGLALTLFGALTAVVYWLSWLGAWP
jgi:hypothetical protein